MKKSFVLYTDKYEAIRLLSREQKGDLLDAIYSYSREEELPEMDAFTMAMFVMIRQGLDENAEKYAQKVEKRKEAGRKGGLASGISRRNEANASKSEANEANVSKSEANEADTDTDTDTDTVTDTVTDTDTVVPKGTSKVIKVAKPPKHTYGEYQHVLLTDQEREKLFKAYGEYTTSECIRFLDEYIEEKGYKSKSHYLAIQRWVVNAVKEKSEKKQTGSGNPFLDAYRAMGGEL